MIRPSNLPKLALCSQFESDPTGSPAAERGSRIDAHFRAMLEKRFKWLENGPAEEYEPAAWAAAYVHARCGAEFIESSEDACRVYTQINGLTISGTMDARCDTMHLTFDLKTGEIRSYREQMAAYALACMDISGASEWTCVLIFCDQREIREHHFHYFEAREIVESIVRDRIVADAEPTVCDYCGWCAKRNACDAVIASANIALGLVPERARFESAIATPDGLAAFLRGAKIIEDWAEIARQKAKARILGGETIPGWKLQSRSGAARVEVSKLCDFGEVDLSKLLPKTVSEKTAREALPSLPESLIERGESTIALMQTKTKN